ncbi:MAG: hypothetical protein M3Q99_08065 [Acidobacteriota bacterium]|nr:hypothetical protein [Acidobacteriota bacterium]
MNWEISRAKESGVILKSAAIKIKSYYQLTKGLTGASVSPNFTMDGIVQALNNATRITTKFYDYRLSRKKN